MGNFLGLLLSLAVAWALAHFAFHSTLQIDWRTMLEIFAISMLAAGIGLIAVSWRHSRSASITQALGSE